MDAVKALAPDPSLIAPIVLSLETSSVEEFTDVFTGSDVVYFIAGAGGKPDEDGQAADERTKKVDYEGAVKVFDAVQAVKGTKPHLILVSAIDLRDSEKIPAHYVSCPQPGERESRIADAGLALSDGEGHRDVGEDPQGHTELHALEVRGGQGAGQARGVQVDHRPSRRTDGRSWDREGVHRQDTSRVRSGGCQDPTLRLCVFKLTQWDVFCYSSERRCR